MKKWIALLLIGMMTFSLAACGGDKKEEKESSDVVAKEETETEKPEKEDVKEEVKEEPEEPAFTPVTGSWEDCEITIVGAEAFVDDDGKDAIRIFYDFANNSNETEAANGVADFTVTQDGYEAEYAYAEWGEETEEDDNDSLSIRPGTCIRCADGFFMKADGGPVVVTMYNFWDEDENITVEFDPQNLPGAPEEELTMVSVEDPQWIADWPSEGVCDEEYYVVIESCEITEDRDGKQLLRVYYQFTNNSVEINSMWFSVNVSAFQDGIQLKEGYPSSATETDDNYMVDIEPGATIQASVCYELLSSNPVEIALEDFWTDSGIGMVFYLD